MTDQTRKQELRDQAAEHRRLGDDFMRKRQFHRGQRDLARRRCNGDFAVSDEMHMYPLHGEGLVPPQVVVVESETRMRGYGQFADREWCLARQLSQDAYRLEVEESLGEVVAQSGATRNAQGI